MRRVQRTRVLALCVLAGGCALLRPRSSGVVGMGTPAGIEAPPDAAVDSARATAARPPRDTAAHIAHARPDTVARGNPAPTEHPAGAGREDPGGGSPAPRAGRGTTSDRAARAAAERAAMAREGAAPTTAELERRLAPAALRVTYPDTMRATISADVRITIERDALAALAPAAESPGGAPGAGGSGTRTLSARTRIGDLATVCLRADTTAFTITGGDTAAPDRDGRCSTRRVSAGAPSPWLFHATPRDTGVKQFEVMVQAAFEEPGSGPPLVVWDSTYPVHVRVGVVPSAPERARKWLDDWTNVAKGLAALVTAIGAIVLAVKKLLGRKTEPEKETAGAEGGTAAGGGAPHYPAPPSGKPAGHRSESD